MVNFNFPNLKVTLGLFGALLLAMQSYAQEKTGDIILDAMQDELWQNKKELKLPDFDAPFFLMYGVQDQKTYVVSGSLGSLTHYSETQDRFRTNTRVLVGNYDFNDESLDDNHFSSPTAHEIELPVDNDYYGIRRSFWSSTDEVYRSAARHFRKHQQTVKESGKQWSEIPHRTFSKSDPAKVLVDLIPFDWKKENHTTLVKNLSGKFLGMREIENSVVAVRFVEGQHYMVTTEGTIAKVPVRSANLLVFASGRTAEGELFAGQLNFTSRTPDGFPAEKKLLELVDELIAQLKDARSASKLEEEYSGPVLILGSGVAESFANAFIQGRDNLMASDNIAKLKGYQIDQSANIESKVGKAIMHESLTMKAKPKLERYNDTELLGSFQIDGEGMVPPDETILVQNGILKTLMDNRTITSASKNVYALGFDDGPGVVEISSTIKNSERELKEKLLQKAKAEGLDYAFIVRDKKSMGAVGADIYRIYVKDGREELVTNAQFETPTVKHLRKLLGVSSTYAAYNINQFSEGRNANVTSYIVPSAILLEEGELKPFNMPTLKEEHFVSSPLTNP